ncbi:MAG: PQQ-dependent sugar dehydrogenase [Candidatus Acidiferrales bacterium]
MRRSIPWIVLILIILGLSFFESRAVSGMRDTDAQSGAVADAGPFVGFRGETPGKVHHITAADLPQPYATKSASSHSNISARPADAWPQVPSGFKVELYASELDNPRLLQTAPNGDLFLAESGPGKILIFRGISSDGKPEQTSEFATGFNRPFGIAFYPPGPDPKYIYIGNTDSVVRIPYQNGDLKARSKPETVIAKIPSGNERVGGGGHWTRNLAFSQDGNKLYVSVGSRTNVTNIDKDSSEYHRANILVARPDGSDLQVYASGIRNPVGLAINPQTGEVWTSVNERDELGDDLPPDYITHVEPGGFYGWPWYYTGGHPDPRFPGKHPELKDKAIVPDVLLEPHDASLELTFYEASQFPAEYRQSIFAAEHGSWNRAERTGYEVVFVPLKNGHASGEYQDFLTGFVTPDQKVWGRPVGVAIGKDGSLFVSDDGSNSIWRVSYVGK